MVVTTTVGTRTHGNNPSRVRHLIVNLSQGWGHFVGNRTGDNHDIGLTRRGSENDTQSILIVSWSRDMHHLDGTTSQTEGDWPKRRLSSPVGNGVQRCQGIVDRSGCGFLRNQWEVFLESLWRQVLGRDVTDGSILYYGERLGSSERGDNGFSGQRVHLGISVYAMGRRRY